MSNSRFNVFGLAVSIISLGTLILDVGTDLMVMIIFYIHGHILWGSLVAALVAIPLLVMNVLSAKWHATDSTLNCLALLPHVFLLAPVQRYLRAIQLGLKAQISGHPRFTDAAFREQSDACILHLIEAFLECAPQLVLMLHIMLLDPIRINWMLGMSAACSLVSMSWALATYCDTLRLACQATPHRRLLALVLHTFCHLCIVAARVAALAVFTLVFQAWVCLFAGGHWLVMTVCIWLKGTDLGSGKAEQWLYRIISGFIYIFVFLNLHQGPTRARMAPYYCLIIVENAALYAVWLIYGVHDVEALTIMVPLVIFGGFFMGVFSLVMYYRWLHPSGPNYLFDIKSSLPGTQQSIVQPNQSEQQMEILGVESSHPLVLFTAGSILEISTELCPDPTIPRMMDSSTREALETAWQSGMDASDTSSDSSLELENCSLDEFNTTCRSRLSYSFGKSQASNNTSKSQLSSATVKSCRSQNASRSQHSCNQSKRSAGSNTSTGRQSNISFLVESPKDNHSCHGSRSVGNSLNRTEQNSIAEEQELVNTGEREPTSTGQQGLSNADQQEPPNTSQRELSGTGQREAADGTESVLIPQRENQGEERNEGRQSRSSLLMEEASMGCSSPDIWSQQLAPFGGEQRTGNTSILRVDNHRQSLESTRTEPRTLSPLHQQSLDTIRADSRALSPLDISGVMAEPQKCVTSSDLSYEIKSSHMNQLSVSFDNRTVTPIVSQGRKRDANISMSEQNMNHIGKDNDISALFPGMVESALPISRLQHLCLRGDISYQQSGGESMWGVSPNSSNTTSSPGQDSNQFSCPRLVDSYDSERDPNTTSLSLQNKTPDFHLRDGNKDPQHKIGNHRLVEVKDSTKLSPPTDDVDSSWSSTKVNANELSGLENLKNLSLEDSIYSFASCDREDVSKIEHGPLAEGFTPDSNNSIASLGASPNLFRSKSTSSLYFDFGSMGCSPSPPCGLQKSHISRNTSWQDTSDFSEPWKNMPDASLRLDYLNLDPAPPVEQEDYRYDPREVLIELLLDQLKRTSLRPKKSRAESSMGQAPFKLPFSRVSPRRHCSSVDLFNRNIWKPARSQLQDSYTSNVDLLKEAFDIIKLQPSPYRSHPQESSSSTSPEMYVSGQYRPPICQEEQQLNSEGPSVRRSTRQSQSFMSTNHTLPPWHHSRHSGSSLNQTTVPGFQGNEYIYHDFSDERSKPESRHQSLPLHKRDGLSRYFMGSVDPSHTPHWNTPAATPIHRHLLHRYLAENQHKGAYTYSHRQPATSQHLHKPPSANEEKGVPSGHAFPYYTQKLPAKVRGRLDVLVDPCNEDILRHTRQTYNNISRRQPLQTLDNSPSLSPNSAYQDSASGTCSDQHSQSFSKSGSAVVQQESSRKTPHQQTRKNNSLPSSQSRMHRRSMQETVSDRKVSVPHSPKRRSLKMSTDCLR